MKQIKDLESISGRELAFGNFFDWNYQYEVRGGPNESEGGHDWTKKKNNINTEKAIGWYCGVLYCENVFFVLISG